MSSLAMHPRAEENTVRNRKKKLKERAKRVINNSTMSHNEKVFVNSCIKSIFEELADIHRVHPRVVG